MCYSTTLLLSHSTTKETGLDRYFSVKSVVVCTSSQSLGKFRAFGENWGAEGIADETLWFDFTRHAELDHAADISFIVSSFILRVKVFVCTN